MEGEPKPFWKQKPPAPRCIYKGCDSPMIDMGTFFECFSDKITVSKTLYTGRTDQSLPHAQTDLSQPVLERLN